MSDDADLILFETMPNKAHLRARIDRLDVSADAKALLNDLLEVVIEVGGRLISAGQRIVAFVFDMMRRFPNTAFGVIVALVLSSLIASIPLLGVVLGPLLTPLLLAFGLAAGALVDLQEAAIQSRISKLEQHFAAATADG